MLQLTNRPDDLLALLDLLLVIFRIGLTPGGGDTMELVREGGDDLGEDGRPSAKRYAIRRSVIVRLIW